MIDLSEGPGGKQTQLFFPGMCVEGVSGECKAAWGGLHIWLADLIVSILELLRILESGRSIRKNITKREMRWEVPRFLPEGTPAAVFVRSFRFSIFFFWSMISMQPLMHLEISIERCYILGAGWVDRGRQWTHRWKCPHSGEEARKWKLWISEMWSVVYSIHVREKNWAGKGDFFWSGSDCSLRQGSEGWPPWEAGIWIKIWRSHGVSCYR